MYLQIRLKTNYIGYGSHNRYAHIRYQFVACSENPTPAHIPNGYCPQPTQKSKNTWRRS